ncbi:hypothetical protein [Emticicia sp. W12TSBA100-4]|uniref:hypothetical protein n=1 Tax=Emticicia sp. W12TSBA100-4 TaxID=3160965 RepID=UPI003306744B
MKKLTILGITLISISAFRVVDDLSKYKVNIPEFKERIINLSSSTTFPGFKFYFTPELKKLGFKLPAAEQAAMARAVGLFAKSFINSVNFSKDYEKELKKNIQNTDPNSAEWKEQYANTYQGKLESTKNDITIAGYTDQVFSMQETILSSSKEALKEVESKSTDGISDDEKKMLTMMKQMYKNSIANAEATLKLKPMLKSNPAEFCKQYAKVLTDTEIQENIRNTKENNASIMEQYEEKKNYKANIKAQLQQFLEESANVDFDAKLVKVGNNNAQDFANLEYRDKSAIWKQSYRIGKPATLEFRKIAEEWLKEL